MQAQQKLFHLVIRVPKEESALVYFIFEAAEGLCFYSTLPFEKGCPYRDLDLKGTLEFRDDVMHELDTLQKRFKIDFIHDEIIDDSENVALPEC